MWKRRLLTVPVALCALALLGGAEGIDKSELECEEAVQHLIDCCPDHAPAKQVDCYTGRGCDDRPPDLLQPQSICLRDASCDDLYARGACSAPRDACVP